MDINEYLPMFLAEGRELSARYQVHIEHDLQRREPAGPEQHLRFPYPSLHLSADAA